MRVLVACEFSGKTRDAFLAKGHDAWSCDLLPTDVPGPHIQGDVLKVLDDGWDLMIGHPECTYLCNSGVHHLHKEPDGSGTLKGRHRWKAMYEGAMFFKRLWDAPIERIAIENPIMHKYAKGYIGASQTQVIQPWMHGHLESKATCLWLKGLAPLVPSNNVKEEFDKLDYVDRAKIHYVSPGPDRWKIRSTTYDGIAQAFADQWG